MAENTIRTTVPAIERRLPTPWVTELNISSPSEYLLATDDDIVLTPFSYISIILSVYYFREVYHQKSEITIEKGKKSGEIQRRCVF